MATKSQIVYNWLNLMEAGRISDDFIPSYAQLSFIADYKRAQYIKQDQNKNYFDNDQFYQDLGCINLIPVDKAECCELALDCNILRSELKIPKLIRLNNRLPIKISAIDNQTRFTLILPERTPFLGHTKFPQMGVKVYWLNNYLYVPETLDIRAIKVRGILENPTDAKTFVCAGEACYTDHTDYPLTADMLDLITKDVMGNELRYLLSTVPDDTNDGQNINKG